LPEVLPLLPDVALDRCLASNFISWTVPVRLMSL
jgi:hypothetical protein